MRRTTLILILIAAIGSAATGKVWAEPAVFRSFDGPELTWRLVDGRPGARVQAHGCVGDDAREGSGSERMIIAAPMGESLHFLCSIGRLPVLDELESRLWIKTNRPGVLLAARVVLPRSIDASTGNPRTILVPGTECGVTNRWHAMRLANVPGRLEAQARIVRMTPGAKVDTREAYIDAIVLTVPGGTGSTAVWTDALEIDGIVMHAAAAAGEATHIVQAVAPVVSSANKSQAAESPLVQFQGTMLMLSGKPFLSLGIEWNSEPLEYLAARGCNTVWIDEPPTRELVNEAAKAGVWLVCRPPAPDSIASSGLGETSDRVLAWNLGSPGGPQEVDYFRRWADLVRRADPLPTRPLVMLPRGDWLPASRLADALVADHPASSHLPAADYAEWIQSVSLLARPGTPFWACIPTQPGDRARGQSATLARVKSLATSVLDDAQIESLVTAAVTSGCRGIVFQSDSPLDAADDLTRRRAVLLETFNRQLDMLSPWLTAGKSIGLATSVDGSVRADVLQVERARLLIPTAWQNAEEGGAISSVVFIVPGIPESNKAFLMSGGDLKALSAKRVAGGMRIALDRDELGLVLLTEDPAVIATYRQHVARNGRRAAQLRYSLALSRVRMLSNVAPQLSRLGANTKNLDKAIGAASAEVAQANTLLTAGKVDASYRRSSAASRMLAAAIAEQQLADTGSAPFYSVPFGASCDMLPSRMGLERAIAKFRGGESLLIGGDFEDLGQLRHFGWRHVDDPLAGIETRVALSGERPHEGSYCLELSAASTPAGLAPQVVGRPLVWITSPPVRVTAGDVIDISGWVRVPQPISGTIDGLEIVDSLGGQELALRVRQTSDWQPFRMIRGADATGDFTLTFALCGVGAAQLDGVMVRTLAAPNAKRLPAIASPPGPAFPNSASRSMFDSQRGR